MTTDLITAATSTPDAIFGLDDPRAIFAKSVVLAGAVIGAVRSDQLDNRTPCPEFKVRDLLGHLVFVLGSVAVVGRGDDPFSAREYTKDVADDQWLRAWIDGAFEVRAAWADGTALNRCIQLPWAELTGAEALAGYTNEVTVHTWDLATATGRKPEWNQRVLKVAFDAIHGVLPADDRAATSAPFADVVEVPADAPLIDRLVAWNGRRP